MIRAISDTAPACYGVACPKHAACSRYAAVETTSPDHTIATCDDGAGGRPLFVAVVQPCRKACSGERCSCERAEVAAC